MSRRLPLSPASRLDRLQPRIPTILENAKWAKKLGYHKLENRDEVHTRSGKSDPTGAVVTNQERIRAAVAEGTRQMAAACDALDRADSAFLVALKLADNKRPLETDPFPQEPKSVIIQMKQAQERRKERGEHHG